MSSEKKGYNFIYMPKRGESKSIHLSSVWLFLSILVFVSFVFFGFKAVNQYQYYKAEYAKISGLSLEATELLQQEELEAIEKELPPIYAIQDKNKEKMEHIFQEDIKNRNELSLNELNLDPKSYLSDVNRYAGYFNNLTSFNLQKAIDLEQRLVSQKERLDTIIASNEVLSLASEDFLEQWEKTPQGFPLPGAIDPGFGYRIHPVWGIPDWHTGVDISGYYGQDVKATASGRVVQSTFSGGYGNVVVVYHRDGIRTLYAHNSKNLVYEGEYVASGQVIAKAGKTGIATCVHTHYEVQYGKKAIDPEKFNNLVKQNAPK
ncbi:MAG: M23 family metallopeptidase [Caldisericia bacterium]|nr:M23 family metallopeptidase [Caldisericia bacterium]